MIKHESDLHPGFEGINAASLKEDLVVQLKELQREIKELTEDTEEMRDKDDMEHENIELRDILSIVSKKFEVLCARSLVFVPRVRSSSSSYISDNAGFPIGPSSAPV